MKKKILVCVQKDINNAISWSLKDLSGVSAQYVDHLYQLEKVLESKINFCGLVIDSLIDGQSTISFLKKLKDEFKLKILLIVSNDTPKNEIVDLIKNKMVDNVLLRPFNANQVTSAVAKICNISRPSETPWYMYTKPQ